MTFFLTLPLTVCKHPSIHTEITTVLTDIKLHIATNLVRLTLCLVLIQYSVKLCRGSLKPRQELEDLNQLFLYTITLRLKRVFGVGAMSMNTSSPPMSPLREEITSQMDPIGEEYPLVG